MIITPTQMGDPLARYQELITWIDSAKDVFAADLAARKVGEVSPYTTAQVLTTIDNMSQVQQSLATLVSQLPSAEAAVVAPVAAAVAPAAEALPDANLLRLRSEYYAKLEPLQTELSDTLEQIGNFADAPDVDLVDGELDRLTATATNLQDQIDALAEQYLALGLDEGSL